MSKGTFIHCVENCAQATDEYVRHINSAFKTYVSQIKINKHQVAVNRAFAIAGLAALVCIVIQNKRIGQLNKRIDNLK